MGNGGILALASSLRRLAFLEYLDVSQETFESIKKPISDEVASRLVESLPQSIRRLNMHGSVLS